MRRQAMAASRWAFDSLLQCTVGTLGAAIVTLSSSTARAETPVFAPRIVQSYPHDPRAFTEGLVFHDGEIFESTGLLGESMLRRLSVATGEVLQSVALPPNEFGEGLALVGDRLIQLTYENGLAHVYDLVTFEERGTFHYQGQGWGLCYDGTRLIMSDGSDKLVFRDPETFAVTGSLGVRIGGLAYSQLNELECVDGEVWANVFSTDFIVRIDASTGQVLAIIDASDLLSREEAAGSQILNGIAFDRVTGHFWLTGKLWPKLLEVDIPRPVKASPKSPTSCSIARTSKVASDEAWLCGLALLVVSGRAAARLRRVVDA